MTFDLKPVAGKSLLYVMAVDNEYGEHLQARFKPLFTGVGPVESAIGLTRALTGLAGQNALPDLVVSLGSAGAADLNQTEVYQASHLSYRDMDASPIGFEKGRTPFLDLPAVLELPHMIPAIPSARLSTGANIVSGDAYNLIDADMVDMESFAAYRVCQAFDRPMVALRGISDGKNELEKLTDWTQYLHIVDEKLAAAVDIMETAISNGSMRI
jgi:adenosylhomocysteine nucleosidase